MELSLKGQKALVTGASSGIGEGIAKALAAAGAAVIVNYVGSTDGATRVVDAIKTAGGEARAIRADVSKEPDVEAMFAEMLAAWGRIDILVSNAGIQKDAAFVDMTLEQWNTVLAVNLTGTFLPVRYGLPHLMRHGGAIVTIASVAAVVAGGASS